MTKSAHRRRGRPAAGASDGEGVKNYPQLSIRLPEETRAMVHALSLIEARPQWQVITEAIDGYVRARPESERSLLNELVGRSAARATRGRPSGRA
jgi:hypothetical protein